MQRAATVVLVPHPADFEPAVVTAVLAHMNGDHADDNLLIARAFGSSTATACRMIGFDGDAGSWSYTVGSAESTLRIPWSAPITQRPEIRSEIVALTARAHERLGSTPRAH